MPTQEQRLEVVAQLIHDQVHRMGYGHSCTRCHLLAEVVRAVLLGETKSED